MNPERRRIISTEDGKTLYIGGKRYEAFKQAIEQDKDRLTALFEQDKTKQQDTSEEK